ncbi:MAG TPA: PRTRC system protein E [Terriglobales bacterium]|nr:PRTRC system protein E [Terriglobales bacterium]
MFTELKQLLARRSLTITVAALANEHLRVNVVPHSLPEDQKVNEQIKYSHKNEVAAVPDEAIKALTTPLSITGTAEEIDAQFPAILSQYVESHVTLQQTFDRASSEISDAVKAIDERNKNKTKEKAAKSKQEEKATKSQPQTKPDENLPLWWTNSSAPAPGTPSSTSETIPLAEVPSENTEAQQCR